MMIRRIAWIPCLWTGLAAGVASAADAAPASSDRRPLFQDWERPLVVLFVTGRQNGYIEPCGCAGLDTQKGGLARRQTLLEQVRARGWNPVPIDLGNQTRRFGRQPEIKFQTTINALSAMRYRAIGLGPDDLRLSVGELIVACGADEKESPLICSNVDVLGFNKATRIVESGGYKIGIAAVLGQEEQRSIQSDEILMSPPSDGLRKAHAELKAARCNIYVLLSYASIEETIALAQEFPDFRIVVTAGGAVEPPLETQRIPGTKSVLVQTGAKGMYAGVLGIFNDRQQPLRYERVPLDARFEDAPEMMQSLAAYQQQLKAMGLAGLGLRPAEHPSGHEFVGSAACQDCHPNSYEVWEQTAHAEATETLVHPTERSEIPRHFDPECLSCHVTGWNPQGFYPYRTGYLDLEASVALHGNGCENCHGPGSRHVAAETGEIDVEEDELLSLRQQMELPLSKAPDNCLQCHDLDNDPHFQEAGAFEEYWEEIKHYED
jgi:hypothetical protein